jgi:amidase
MALGCSGGARPIAEPALHDREALIELSLRDQVAAIEAGKLTGEELARAYLERIDRLEPSINAIIALDPQAAAKAAALDRTRGSRALLQGAVILVKDNIDTQGIATTAGSLAMAKNIPAADAFAVVRLHAAHALMLGKANLSEWANFRGAHSISGWSSLGGQTTHGLDNRLNPCGSSSGSAAAVAAKMASAALGTETDGSIICPASVHGLVGFKPTVGLVSRANVIPIAASQDTIGPITRTVGDAARLMSVIAGPDPADPATLAIPKTLRLDFEAPLATATLKGKRLGVVDFGYDAGIRELFARERDRLVAAGAQVIDVKLDLGNVLEDELLVLEFEMKDGLDKYLASHRVPGQPASLEELIAFNTAHADTVMPYFGQELLVASQKTTGLAASEYLAARKRLLTAARTKGIDAVLAEHHLDALIAPSMSAAWPLSTKGDPDIAVSAAGPAAIAGYPHLTVPMGKVGEAPIGLSFFGAAWDDAKILALGYAYEQLPR